MTQKFQIYKCEICGNIVEVLHEGAGTLVCCGKPMNLQKENFVDASKEKHVPVIEENNEGVAVKIGSVPHPMTPEHYIEWIEISTETGESKKFLNPEKNKSAEAKFPVKKKISKSREYCNLHGLWRKENN